ncbi:isopentenyl phosphate kinase [Thermogladius sp. 4427co]|uniref:isopentenyl phosphate kinase n=1 Tax=Thermogladius sp. 4427co TaxID=3450718 RepID=UPI003F795FA3
MENNIKQGIVFMKAGGSFITFKDRPFSLNFKALSSLVEILKGADGGKRIILGNGGGSFAHTTVSLLKGRVSDRTMLAMCQGTTRLLNKILVDYLIDNSILAVSIQTSSIIYEDGGSLIANPRPVKMALEKNLIPVVYGECVFSDRGYRVVSTEEVFELIAGEIQPSIFIFLMDVDGIYTCNPVECGNAELIDRVDKNNFERVMSILANSKNRDVTGGIFKKLESAVRLSRIFKVPVVLMSGFRVGEVVKVLNGDVNRVAGTVVDMST